MTNGAPYGAPPLRTGEKTERGVYIFFNATNWRRERREIVLDYEQLDTRTVPVPAPSAVVGGQSGMAGGGGNGSVGRPSGVGSSQVPGA